MVLTVWFFATVHWAELLDALGSVSLVWTAVASVVLLGEFGFRTVRWRVLLGHLDPGVPFRSAFSALVIGAAMNTLLPFRGGDLIRPAVLARERRISFASVLVTTVVERVFDIVGLLCVLGATLALIPPELSSNPVFSGLRIWGLVFVCAALVAIALAFLLVSQGARRLVERISGALPEAIGRRLIRVYDQLAEGFAIVGHPRRLVFALVLTLAMWTNGLVAILCLFQAFALDLGVVAGLFTQCGLAAIVAVPQAPGYWGAFQVAVSSSLMLFGTGESFAKASAILFWAVSFVPVTVIGLLAWWRSGYRSMLRLTEVD